MSLTSELLKERLEMLREQMLFIQATKDEERNPAEREWLSWAERRMAVLQKEVQP